MKKHGIIALLVIGTLLAGTAAWGQERPVMGQFSADTTNTMRGEVQKGRIFVSKDRMRMETQKKGGEQGAMIIRMDKGVTWMLMPEEKKYMEMSGFDQANAPKAEKEISDIAEVKKLGNETVSGYPCEVTQYIYKDKSLGVLTMWISKKLGYQVKMEMKKGSNIESSNLLTNIKEGPQPASLFELPAGYEKFGMPGMPGLPGLGGGGSPFKLPGKK